MNLLCINTAFINADIAVNLGDKRKYKKFDSTFKHSEHVMQGIDDMLENVKVCDLDYMAVCVGTGSFTGIRIGIAVAEGFKTANDNLKLVELNSFELAVENILNFTEKKYAVVFNALGGRYFVQYYIGKTPVSTPLLLTQQEIEDVEKIGLEGEKLDICDKFVNISPESVLNLAEQKIKTGNFADSLQPLYVRQSQAEENLQKVGK